MGKSVLTLDTIEPDRDFIAIDGKPFYLRADDELSTSGIAKVRRLAKRVSAGLSDDATDEQIAEMDGYADKILDVLVIDLPAEMKGRLNSAQKLQIVSAFMTAASSKRAGATAGNPITGG